MTRLGARVVLDAEGEPLRQGIEAEPWLVSPNQHEAEQLVGQELDGDDDFVMALDQIAEMGARNVHITMETGCFALVREERQVKRLSGAGARARARVSVLGAGDVFLARWLAALDGGPYGGGGAPPRRRGRVRLGARGRRRALRPARGGAARRRSSRSTSCSRSPERRRDPATGCSRSPPTRLVESAHLEFELDRDAKFGKEGLAFDDVLLVPAESAVLPNDVATATRLTPTIALEIPIVSAAMDTVTESRLAIALAREGGIGIIHRNLSIEHQVAEIDKVKRSEAGMIVEPVTLGPDDLVTDALDLMARYRVSGVPITSPDGRPRRHPHEPRPPLRCPRRTRACAS